MQTLGLPFWAYSGFDMLHENFQPLPFLSSRHRSNPKRMMEEWHCLRLVSHFCSQEDALDRLVAFSTDRDWLPNNKVEFRTPSPTLLARLFALVITIAIRTRCT
ncbi:unnamed protein product [Durusdinium trenchii]|uniref:Uncharacterized protein n=1 Tax=Durusdinium trenchii TaxID=1381693 RepID=A0ABP0KLQ7_9DINO